jgi:hypothetical protein
MQSMAEIRNPWGGVVLSIDELAEGVPGGTMCGAEVVRLSITLSLADQDAELLECSQLFGRQTGFDQGAREGALRAAGIGTAIGTPGKRLDFTGEVVLAGSARAEGTVLETKPVKFGMGRQAAVAAVGKREAAKGRCGGMSGLARHGISVA